MKYSIKDICEKCKLNEAEIENIYLVGSRVYGTDNSSSDYDFIVVTNSKMNNQEFRNGELNIHVYTVEHFEQKLKEQKMLFIEAVLSPIKLIENKKFTFILNKELFINELIKNSDETLKLFEKERYNYPKAIKKVYHSIRILISAESLLSNNTIDFTETTEMFNNIRNEMYNNDIEKYIQLRIQLVNNLRNKL